MRDGHVIDTRNTSEMNRADMIAKMVGRTIENEYPRELRRWERRFWRSEI